jgi:hypothetical protein
MTHCLTRASIYANSGIRLVLRGRVPNYRLAERRDGGRQLVRQRQEGPHLRNLELPHVGGKHSWKLLGR